MDYFKSKDSVTILVHKAYFSDNSFFRLDALGIPSDEKYLYSDDHLSEVNVVSGGCSVEGHGYDCTKACLDPKLAFQDMATVQNCISYPYISYALEHDNLTIDDSYDNFESYGFLNQSSVDLPKIGEVIFNCFNEFSKDQNGCARWFNEPLSEDVRLTPF